MDNEGDLDTIFNDDKPTAQGSPEVTVSTPEVPKKEETPKQEAETPAPAEGASLAGDIKKEESSAEDGKNPEAPKADPVGESGETNKEQPQEPVKPLTADEARALFNDIRNQERESKQIIEEAEKEVIAKYYPQGLSNVLVDEKTGKELRSPQDVVDLTNGEMSIEEATRWLMNEQYKLDTKVAEIKQSARELAEVNANFKQGAARVLETYKDVFAKYPQLQNKVFKNYMKAVKMDNEKDLILSAPDIEEYYRDFMEPYLMNMGEAAPAPAQTPSADAPKIPDAPKQTAADRMDVSGDAGGGTGGDDDVDPNDPVASLNKLFGE